MSLSTLRSLAVSLLLVAATPAFAQKAGLTLACIDVNPDTPAKEASLIAKLADGKVVRKSQHLLLVQGGGRTIRLADAPPYDEALAGTRYRFCDRRDGFILLRKEQDVDFTGTLIDETSGAVVDAGQQVILSADRRAYFATVQPDGLDGEEWSIHFANGNVSWSGYSFIDDEVHPGYASAYLSKPQWLPKGAFTALAECAEATDRTWRVTLTKAADGTWDWRPKGKCPPAHHP